MLKLVKVEEDKNINISNKINEFKNPTYIYIPVNQELKKGNYIYKNMHINDYISSISGTIIDIKKMLFDNKLQDVYVIKNDYQENIKIKKRKKKITTIEELINILEEYSLTTISTKLLKIKEINNLVISSIDEEIYSTKEFIRLANNYSEILDSIDYLLNILKLKTATIATKNTNFKSIKNVKSIIGTYPNIKLNLVPDKYLISRKDFLCEYLNFDIDTTLLLTTNEIYDIYNILNKGKEKTEMLLTISGNALEKSLIFNVRVNMSLDEIIKNYVNIIEEKYNIYINGFLAGIKITDYKNIVITKNIHSIVIIKYELEEETKCINCGACQKICPYNIEVKTCYFNRESSKKCIGCGLCNFICPAKIDLRKIVNGDNNEK